MWRCSQWCWPAKALEDHISILPTYRNKEETPWGLSSVL
ncbi:hypothetical protein U0070_012401 [Myodes glareolus]|uniref:Uncharacterized protein n=1 Tax=Myodes glareolus TaxID=447135 RepID=A0AAW0IEE5_MYOGA